MYILFRGVNRKFVHHLQPCRNDAGSNDLAHCDTRYFHTVECRQQDLGTFRLGHGVSLGYYAQEHEGIRAGVPVLAHVRQESDAEEPILRALLGMFGLTGDIAKQDAGTLSGGEKTKLALSQLVAGRHNLLLLDEPTNNLDPPSRVGVAQALAAWPGTMVVVSHDPEFVEALKPARVLFMPEGRIDYWDNDFLDVVSMA